MRTIVLASISFLFFTNIDLSAIGQEKEPSKIQDCLKKAFDAAREIPEKSERIHLLMEIGLVQAASGDVGAARNTVKEMNDTDPVQALIYADSVASVLTEIASAQAINGDIPGAKATLKEAERKSEEAGKGRSQDLLLHGIIEIYVKIAQDAEAARIADSFTSKMDWGYAQVNRIEGLLAAGQRNEAKAVLATLAAKFSNTSEYVDMFVGSIWESIWTLSLQLDNVEGALAMARAIPNVRFERCRALEAIAIHQSKAGKATAAATFAEAFQAARDINDKEGVCETQMYRVVVAQAKAGFLAEAIINIELIPSGGAKFNAMVGVATMQAKAGNQAEARKTLDAAIRLMEKKLDNDPSALVEIAACQAEIHEKEAAINTVAKALDAVRKIEMTGWDRAYSLGCVAEVQAKIGDRQSAEKTLEEAVRLAGAITDEKSRAEEVQEIAKAQIAAGFMDAAQATLHNILLPILLQKSIQSEHSDQDAVLLFAKTGNYFDGYAIARTFGECYCKVRAFATIAAYHAQFKDPDHPTAFAEKERDPLARSAMYLGTALGLLRAKGIKIRSQDRLLLIEE
jgi:tetratricopeptide (TPR) repeat protein